MVRRSGNDIKPGKSELEVKIGKTVLTPADYVITGYENNRNVGTAKLYIKGINDYCGEKAVTYRIGKRRILWWSFD